MKATLIKLDTKVIDIPRYRPVWRELVKPDGFELAANYEGMNPSFIPYELKTVDYRVVRIAGGKDGENGYYLVNDEMWFVAMIYHFRWLAGNYDRCIEVVKMYKNANERMR